MAVGSTPKGAAKLAAKETVGQSREQAEECESLLIGIEVLGASQLPKAEVTSVQLSGFAIDGTRPSQPAGLSMQPSGWLFLSLEGLKAEQERKMEEEKLKKIKSSKLKGDQTSRPTSAIPPVPVCNVRLPIATDGQRSQALGAMCTPLKVALVRVAEAAQFHLGCATVELQSLIHDSPSVELEVELHWSSEYLAELRDAGEKVALQPVDEEAESAAADYVVGVDSSEGSAQRRERWEPPPGKLRLIVSTGSPIGRTLCPEDLDDWAVLTVHVDGCFRLPEKLLEVGGSLPPGSRGVVTTHPLKYSLGLLSCRFDGGQLVIPDLPVGGEDPFAAQPRSASPKGPFAPSLSRAASPKTVPRGATPSAPPKGAAEKGQEIQPLDADIHALLEETVDFDVGKEEFVEGLLRSGFPESNESGVAIFNFLSRPYPGIGKRIGQDEFAKLEELPLIAGRADLLKLFGLLVEQHGDVDTAFKAFDSSLEGSLGLEQFCTCLEQVGCTAGLEAARALFAALDSQRADRVDLKDFLALPIHQRYVDMQVAERVTRGLLGCVGSIEGLIQQADESNSGVVSLEKWDEMASRLQYPDSQEARVAFNTLDKEKTGLLRHEQLHRLGSIDTTVLMNVLLQLAALLLHHAGGVAETAVGGLLGSSMAAISSATFLRECTGLGFTKELECQAVVAFLDDGTDHINATTLHGMLTFAAAERQRRILDFRHFINRHGDTKLAFKRLFDYQVESCMEAESSLPQIKWPKPEVTRYCGRQWLQQLLNTLADERGRRLGPLFDNCNVGGDWLHFFPMLSSQTSLSDFKEIADPALSGHARVARWHHAQAFVDLRRLQADSDGEKAELEFRAFLSHISAQPHGVIEAPCELSPFSLCNTYVKGTIKLDRTLQRLCPRHIASFPIIDGLPLIPPAPEKPPPPSAGEELEYEVRSIVGRLAIEFSRMCQERGLENTPNADPGGIVDEHKLLGHRGVVPSMFLEWLQLQDDGALYKDLSAELRPAIVRLVRTEVKHGPAGGIKGNKSDALYTSTRDLILKHIFIALNHDIEVNKRKRDAQLWRSPPLEGDVDISDPAFVSPTDLAANHCKRDLTLQRLIFEYESMGDVEMAMQLFAERLQLPQNLEQCEVWYNYARFLMRCARQQPEAEKALKYAISLRPAEEGPSFKEAAFLACMLLVGVQSHADVGNAQQPERVEAARTLLATAVDKRPGERVPLLFLFFLYSFQASNLESELNAIAKTNDSSVAAGGIAARHAQLVSLATKYVRLAQLAPDIFTGVLSCHGRPCFRELEELVHKENLNRGITKESAPRPQTPVAWRAPEMSVFPSYQSIHPPVEKSDESALECIDLMLHFGMPQLVRFLIMDLSQTYGLLSPSTVMSERCRLQLIRALMLQEAWDDAIMMIDELFTHCTDRICEAHKLLGECHFRLARSRNDAESYMKALKAFQSALSFFPMPDASALPKNHVQDDPVVHLRVASLYYRQAEKLSFQAADMLDKAFEHFRHSLQLAPTAEAWRSAGVCLYRQAELQAKVGRSAKEVQACLIEATSYLSQANLLDKTRPQINAHLAMCSVKLGRVQVAKQTIRQVLCHQRKLEVQIALELAEVLLKYSDESWPAQEERGWLVLDGRYLQEAISVACGSQSFATKQQIGELDCIVARAYSLQGDFAAAVEKYCAAVSSFQEDPPHQEMLLTFAKACAAKLIGKPEVGALVEQTAAQIRSTQNAFVAA